MKFPTNFPTPERLTHMRLIACLALVSTLFLAGCGRGSGPRYSLTDHEKTANAFIEATREYYATRTGGKLSEPGISGDRVHFVYRYELIKNGQHAEQADVYLSKERTVRSNTGEQHTEPASFTVGAWFQQEGTDPEIPEARDAILDGMRKRLGDFQPIK